MRSKKGNWDYKKSSICNYEEILICKYIKKKKKQKTNKTKKAKNKQNKKNKKKSDQENAPSVKHSYSDHGLG